MKLALDSAAILHSGLPPCMLFRVFTGHSRHHSAAQESQRQVIYIIYTTECVKDRIRIAVDGVVLCSQNLNSQVPFRFLYSAKLDDV